MPNTRVFSADQEAAFGLSSGWVRTRVGLVAPQGQVTEAGKLVEALRKCAGRYEMGLGKEGCSLHVVFIKPGAVGI